MDWVDNLVWSYIYTYKKIYGVLSRIFRPKHMNYNDVSICWHGQEKFNKKILEKFDRCYFEIMTLLFLMAYFDFANSLFYALSLIYTGEHDFDHD